MPEPGPSPGKRTLGLPRALAPYAFVVPPLAFLALFMFWPLGREIWMSLTDTTLLRPNSGRFVGVANYRRLLSDANLLNALKITLIYTIGSVVFGVAIGMIAALAIDRPFRGRSIARSVLLFGWAVPSVATALVWTWMFNEHSGVLDTITAGLGLGRVPWLTSVDVAMLSLLTVTVWQVAPFVMLVLLAALQSVPEEAREAARIDGADALSVFRAVTLPHIMPAVQLAGLLVAVWSIRRFDTIFLLTGGGPLDSTATLVVKLRQVAFENHQLGMAGAYGTIGLVLALLVGALHYTADRRRMRWTAP